MALRWMKLAAVLDLLTHQDGEDLVGDGGVLEPDLEEGAALRVHGGLPQLVGVHLAETLVPLGSTSLAASGVRA